MVKFARLVQPLNAYLSIEVTLLPMFTLFKPEQDWNALRPMVVTELGIITSVNPLQELKV